MFKANRPRLRRVLVIHTELMKGEYVSAKQLAELNETTPKTIREDLDYMRFDQGAPIEYSPKFKKWFYSSPSYELPNLRITEGEVVALFLAEQMLQQHRGLPYEVELTRAVEKLVALLPAEISIRPRTLAHTHSFRSSVVSVRDIEVFRKLADAVLKHKQLELTYYTASRDQESTRTVDPIHLTCVDGEWYLVGFCHTRNERRMFAPSRIRKLVVTNRTFVPDEAFQIGDFLGESFRLIREDNQPLQRIHLRFAPTASKYIREKIWHKTEEQTVNADGSVDLNMFIRSLIEIRRWILSWGAECEVVSPPELREDILNQASAIVNRNRTVSKSSGQKRRGSRKPGGDPAVL